MPFTIDKQTGLLSPARQVQSPNHDERPDPQDISLIVIHCISLPPGQYGGPWIDQLFTNQLDPAAHPYFKDIYQLEVSSHLLLRRDGEVVQYVPLHRRAWHAGKSNYQGRERCNDFSIGIELEGSDSESYEEVQYQQLTQIILGLCQHYETLSKERITGHSDIAPGRKTDPGPGFDWDKLHSALK